MPVKNSSQNNMQIFEYICHTMNSKEESREKWSWILKLLINPTKTPNHTKFLNFY